MTDEIEADSWYWDRRTNKALYPQQVDDNTIQFVTVWHREEVEDALDNDALVPLSEIGLDRADTTLDLIQSFRTANVNSESGADGSAVSGGSEH